MVIYWDVLLAVNLILNAVILYLTSISAGIRTSTWRIFSAALLGAGYVVASGIAEELMTPIAKALLSIVLVVIALGYRSWRTLIFNCSVFYLVSFAIGGAVLGWLGWWENSKLDSHLLTVGGLGSGALIGAAVTFFCLRRSMNRSAQRTQLVHLRITCDGRTDHLQGMLDTGNTLTATTRCTPVIVACYTAVPTILGNLRMCLDRCEEGEWIQAIGTEDTLWRMNYILIPYRTVSAQDGILIGMRADEVIIEAGGRIYHATDVILAITKRQFSNSRAYSAIVPSRLLDTSELVKEGII